QAACPLLRASRLPRGPTPLRLEVECALYSVAALEFPDHAVARNGDLMDAGARHIGWRARDGAEDAVVQRRRPALRIGVGRHLGVGGGAAGERALAVHDLVVDGHIIERDGLAYQLEQIGRSAAELTCKDV